MWSFTSRTVWSRRFFESRFTPGTNDGAPANKPRRTDIAIRGTTMFQNMRVFVLVGSAATWIAPHVHGQAAAINGEISGSVTDSSGAAVVGAMVQIVNEGTGFKQSTRTTDTGLYRFNLVPLGTYEL